MHPSRRWQFGAGGGLCVAGGERYPMAESSRETATLPFDARSRSPAGIRVGP